MKSTFVILIFIFLSFIPIAVCQDTMPEEAESQKKLVASFEGIENATTTVFLLQQGPATFKVQLEWDQPDPELDFEEAKFTVLLLTEDRKLVEMVIGTIDHFDGARTIEIPNEGKFRLNITAPGDWKVRIEQ